MSDHHPRLLDSNQPGRDLQTQEATEHFRRELYQGASDADWRAASQPRGDSTVESTLPPLEIIDNNVRRNERMFDPDGNGVIERDTLNRLAARQGLDGETSATVVGLIRNYDRLAQMHDDSRGIGSIVRFFGGQHRDPWLTVEDLDAAAGNGTRMTPEGAAFFNSMEHASEQDHSLFGINNEVSPAAVSQGTVGDCSLHAVLASMATTEQGQEMIRNMIQRDGENYRVTFPDGQSVSVEPPTDAEMAMYAHNTGFGIWPAVVERAYGRLIAQRDPLETFRHRSETPQLAAENCAPHNPFETLTAGGDRVQHIDLTHMSDDQIDERLQEFARNPLAMVADTRVDESTARAPLGVADVAKASDEQEALVPNHAYALADYDAETRTVYVQNPWHAGTLLAMPLSQFRRQFVDVSAMQSDEQ